MSGRDEVHRGAMRTHALRRLYQRHGLALTNADFGALVDDIASGRNQPVGHGRAGGKVHLLQIRGRAVYAIWDAEQACIATFLPGREPYELKRARRLERQEREANA